MDVIYKHVFEMALHYMYVLHTVVLHMFLHHTIVDTLVVGLTCKIIKKLVPEMPQNGCPREKKREKRFYSMKPILKINLHIL